MGEPLFRRVLIANRGEIAVRVLRACQEMGIGTVAVYSEADAGALHVALADSAALIGPPAPSASYLRGERILEVAHEFHCDAIHPGYGFLSENAEFAAAVREQGMTFIGPTPEAMRRLGSKTAARAVARAVGVRVVPGYQEQQDDATLLEAAQGLGFPLLVKATAGGGGKGMRRVDRLAELPAALASARREAQNAFGDDQIYMERLIEHARHVEIQVLGDQQGAVVHLGERECSVQRRHQKIIEEAPSPLLDESLREQMGAAAVAIARAAGYSNAGTMEFLVDPERTFYFLETNARLQVEHPVTETVTGLDLVKLQIRIAAGEPLPFTQQDVRLRGHAMECRVYAEDVAAGFLPSTGAVHMAVEPAGPGVRVDAGVGTGDMVTLHYDPMIAKVIVQGSSRADAIGRMLWALRHYVLLGEVTTNLAFLQAVLAHPTFAAGAQTTDFCETAFAGWMPPGWPTSPPPDVALIAAALGGSGPLPRDRAQVEASNATVDPFSPWQAPSGFRMGQGGAP
ncbi:MAG: acetyl-CoA carboxylase biotin carboxylase subunit [Caldilineaceae bacterium]